MPENHQKHRQKSDTISKYKELHISMKRKHASINDGHMKEFIEFSNFLHNRPGGGVRTTFSEKINKLVRSSSLEDDSAE